MGKELGDRKPWVESSKLGAKALVKGVASLIPGAGIAVEAFNALEEHQQQRVTIVLQAAIERLNVTVEELNARLSHDEELVELWQRAMNAARSARLESKRAAYASIMAGAVDADHNDRVAANVLIRLLDQLEEEHLQVVDAIRGLTQPRPKGDELVNFEGAEPEELKQHLPHLAPVIDILVSSLVSFNIIRNVLDTTWAGVEGRKRYALTESGLALSQILIGN